MKSAEYSSAVILACLSVISLKVGWGDDDDDDVYHLLG